LVLSVVETVVILVLKLNERRHKARRYSQVLFKEMSEMRANHRRGIVKNHVIAQNQRDGDPKR
jgi:hypothetical protein